MSNYQSNIRFNNHSSDKSYSSESKRNIKPGISVEVRNNNVEKAMRILKKKLQEDGLFNELREREAFMSKGERRRKSAAAGRRREQKKLEERMEEQGY
jgi:small subunit ribosomal protein S21